MSETSGAIKLNSALNEQGAAEVLGVSVRTLQGWRVRGGGPRFCKLGRRIIYRPHDLSAFMDGCSATSTTEVDARRSAHD